MRKFGRTDANQRRIVGQLRELGITVQSLAAVGDGCPDLLIGHGGQNFLVEIKNPDKPPSARGLTPMEAHWLERWRGRVFVCETLNEVLNCIYETTHKKVYEDQDISKR